MKNLKIMILFIFIFIYSFGEELNQNKIKIKKSSEEIIQREITVARELSLLRKMSNEAIKQGKKEEHQKYFNKWKILVEKRRYSREYQRNLIIKEESNEEKI